MKEKCCKCGKKAVTYMGLADPDATQSPYCRRCCDITKEKITLMLLGGVDEKRAEKIATSIIDNKV